MKVRLLLVFTSLALAVAKDYRPMIYEQASPGHHIRPNVIDRSLAHKPQHGDYDEGGSSDNRDDDSEAGPDYDDKDRADVDAEDPKPEPAETQDPSYEDTTALPPTSTADAQAEDPSESEPMGEESSSYNGPPWPADTDATTVPPTSTADAEAIDPPASEPTQKDRCYEDPSQTEDKGTATITSTSTVTHFVTVPFPTSSSGPSANATELAPTSSGIINAAEPIELAESPPDVGVSGPVSIVPLDTRSANSSIPYPTGPESQLCSWPCEDNSPSGAEESSPESAIPPIESRPSAWPTNVPSGLLTERPWNRTVASAAMPRKTTTADEEPWGGSAGHQETPEPTDTADAVQPPATGEYPEAPTTEPMPPPDWSPTTGAVASHTEQAEGTSGTRRWMPDVGFAGAMFMLMALVGEL